MFSKDYSLEEMLKRHPAEVAQLQVEAAKKLKKSKAKNKGTDVSELLWRYEWCVRVRGGYSVRDLFSGKIQSDSQAWDTLSLEEKVDDAVSRTMVSLTARMPGATVSVSVPVPPELVENYRENYAADASEKARIAAMSPEERQELQDEAIRSLQKLGFTRP
jgi:hypothetical protein